MKRPTTQLIAFAALTATMGAAEFHIAETGNDANRGTKAAPLRTIQRAADLAQPGDVITAHEGIYRELINPPRGGKSDTRRIVYQAAPGEKVEIKGSEVIKSRVKIQDALLGKAKIPGLPYENPDGSLLKIGTDYFGKKRSKTHPGAGPFEIPFSGPLSLRVW